ncbi:hypothetical protein R1sor_016268 [Riccia sorocarpa]|uniref:Uncharacterized protein n=1 Tax=Riccia sorocarpa TaxID=122646 RepID=A0ABD3HKP3_9MARC
MLVLFTGDHPAQCKFGGFATSGYSGCRRCKMKSRICNVPNSRVVVYDSNREQYRHPPARKTVSELREATVDLNACVIGAARKELSQRTGVTGDSQVWKLFDLYGFNPSEDRPRDLVSVVAEVGKRHYEWDHVRTARPREPGVRKLYHGMGERDRRRKTSIKKPLCGKHQQEWTAIPAKVLGVGLRGSLGKRRGVPSSDLVEVDDAGDNHVLAISTGPYRRHSTLFEEVGIGHPSPHPEVHDVMLAVHLPDCPMTAIEHCVITSIHVSDGGPTLAERGDVEGAVPVRGRTTTTVQVQWLRRTFPLRWEVNNKRNCCRSMPASQLRQRLEGFARNCEARMWEHSPR